MCSGGVKLGIWVILQNFSPLTGFTVASCVFAGLDPVLCDQMDLDATLRWTDHRFGSFRTHGGSTFSPNLSR